MGRFLGERVVALYNAAIASGLAPAQDALLAGLPNDYIASLPDTKGAAARLLETLHALNDDVGDRDDGIVAIVVWLRNAAALADDAGRAVFNAALQELGDKPVPGPRLTSAPGDVRDLRGYLQWFVEQMARGIRQGPSHHHPSFVPPEGVAVPAVPASRGQFPPDYVAGSGEDWLRPVRHQMRIVSELSRGARDVTAQLAIADRRNRPVRNVLRTLDRGPEAIVVLGEPGSGKSTVLRQISLEYAKRELERHEPRLVVRVELGSYRSVARPGVPGDVLELVRSFIPTMFAGLRPLVEQFAADGRLIVLFDAMDEMEGSLYSERTQALDDFARRYAERVKCIFACRTANFSPLLAHRRIVLLPFTQGKIEEYIRENFPKQTVVDGQRYSPRQLARRLLSDDVLGDTARVPLTLYLLRDFLTAGQWPRNRSDLYRAYVRSVASRLCRHLAKDDAATHVSEDQLIVAWSQLAFNMMWKDEGTSVRRDEVRVIGQLDLPDLADWCERSGLLRRDIQDDESSPVLRFIHHQIQEYLAANHLLTQPRGVDKDRWSALIDSPRWQETLLHATSMRAEVPIHEVLHATYRTIDTSYAELELAISRLEDKRKALKIELDAIVPDGYSGTVDGVSIPEYGPEKTALRNRLSREIEDTKEAQKQLEFSVPADQERRFADRIVFGSRILMEAGSEAQLPSDLVARYVTALRALSSRGRATSQVKMLWAYRNAPDVCDRTQLSAAFNSRIAWVREQAITVVAGLTHRRVGRRSDLAPEILHDFGANQFLWRLPAYLRVCSTRPSTLALVLWAVFCSLAAFVGVVASSLATIIIYLRAFASDAQQVSLDRCGLAFAFSLGLVLASWPFFTWPLVRRLPVVVGIVTTIVIAFGYHTDGFTFGETVRTITPVATACAISLGVMYFVAQLFAVPVSLLRRQRPWTLMMSAGRCVTPMPELIGLLTVAVLGAFIAFLTGVLACVALVTEYWKDVVGLLAVWAILAYLTFFVIRCRRESILAVVKSDLGAAISIVMFGALIVAVLWLGKGFESIELSLPGWMHTFWGILGMLLGGFVIVVVGLVVVAGVSRGVKVYFSRIASRLRFFLRFLSFTRREEPKPVALTAERWKAELRATDSFGQAALLARMDRDLPAMSTRETLALLETCETFVADEPALSQYWGKRHRAEEILKQEQAPTTG